MKMGHKLKDEFECDGYFQELTHLTCGIRVPNHKFVRKIGDIKTKQKVKLNTN